MKKRINALSLFANVGIAEAYLEEIGIDVVVANETSPGYHQANGRCLFCVGKRKSA